MSKNKIVIFLLLVTGLLMSVKLIAATNEVPTTIINITNNTKYPISRLNYSPNFHPAPPMTIDTGLTAITDNTSSADPSEVIYGELAEQNNQCRIVVARPDTKADCQSASVGASSDSNIQCSLSSTQYNSTTKTCNVQLTITGGPQKIG